MRSVVPECRRCREPMRRHSVQTVKTGEYILVFECERCGRLATANSVIDEVDPPNPRPSAA
jgi:hypothetical protein